MGRQVLKARVISALALGLAALVLTWLGGPFFRVLIAAGGVAVFYEWSMIVRSRQPDWFTAMISVLMAIVTILIVMGAGAGTLWAVLAAGILIGVAMAFVVGAGGWSVAGLAYAGAPAIALSLLRDVGIEGLVAILYLFAVVWATDIFAYFAGRRFGGPRLAPAISPGKTWSGAVGGTLGGVAAGGLVIIVAGVSPLGLFLMLAVLLSMVSQIGDLFESFVKRRFGVKDSGRLVPGHGGFMDRVDGLIAGAVLLYAMCALAGSAQHPAMALFAR